MLINEGNIDQWMFEYHENTLSASDRKTFLLYLEEHPDLKAELALWTAIKIEEPLPEYIPFENTLMHPSKGTVILSKLIKPFMYMTLASLTGVAVYFTLRNTPSKESFSKQTIINLPSQTSKQIDFKKDTVPFSTSEKTTNVSKKIPSINTEIIIEQEVKDSLQNSNELIYPKATMDSIEQKNDPIELFEPAEKQKNENKEDSTKKKKKRNTNLKFDYVPLDN